MAIGECGRVGAQLAETVLVFKPPDLSMVVKAHPGSKNLLGTDFRRRQQDKAQEYVPTFSREFSERAGAH
jgi:hypothetical protein